MKKLAILVVLVLALAIPLSANAAGGVTYTSGVQVQNLGASTANIVIDFYDQAGSVVCNATGIIPTTSSQTFFPLPGSCPPGFSGSAVISSDQQVAAITNVLGNNSQRGDSYGGFAAGATPVNLPLIMKGNFGYDTWFSVQNTGSTDATVTVNYKPGSCSETKTIKPNAAMPFDQATNTCLPAGFVGAASVSSGQPVAIVLMQVGTANLLTYGGFADTSTNPMMPLISSNYYNSASGIQIQNTGGAPTDVTVTYTPSQGFPGAKCTETHTVPAGQSVTFGNNKLQLPAGCGTGGAGVTDTTNGGFVGSAAVTTNTASQPLVAIANQISHQKADASSYDAINPANGTAHVSLPLIMDRNFGYFTGFSIVNVGQSATSISCTFVNNSFTVSQNNVAPGSSMTAVQLNKLSAGYVGSATCTASGGDAKIAGIVNESRTGRPTTEDVQFTYPGFNY